MTVQTTTSRADYTGNGSTTAFTVPFYFLDNSHLLVLRTQISTGVTTTLVITTDYTVTGAGVGAGGTITALVAPTSDQKISILRNVPLTQLTHYVENDPFPAASHEKALDQLTMEAQQINETVSRAIFIPKADSGITTELPTATLRANKALVFDANGNVSVSTDNFNNSATAAAASAAAAAASQAAASASQTAAAVSAAAAAVSASTASDAAVAMAIALG